MSKKTIIITIVAIVAILGIGVTAYTVSTGVFDPYEQQIRLGYKYLSEMKYEEAIVAFDTAISIEAKRDKAYIGKADTYLAKGGDDAVAKIDESLKAGYDLTQSIKIIDTYAKVADKFYADDNLDFVAQILEFGYKATSNEKIVDAYIKIADDLSANDKNEAALDLLRKGFDVTGNEKLKDKIAEIIDKVSSAFMKNLYGLFEVENIDEVKNVIRTDEFGQIAAYTTETESAFYSPTSTGTDKSGKGVGIYTMQGEHFVYYGDYADNARNGQGMWLNFAPDLVGNGVQYDYVFDGQWANDKPNGEGRSERIAIGSIPDNYSRRWIEQGTYSDGLESGNITNEAYNDDGTHYLWNFMSTNGIAPRISTDHDMQENTGEYTIAESEDEQCFLVRHEGDRSGVGGYSTYANHGE